MFESFSYGTRARCTAAAMLLTAALWCAVAPAAAAAAPVTFSRDVAPILFTHCAGCHHPG